MVRHNFYQKPTPAPREYYKSNKGLLKGVFDVVTEYEKGKFKLMEKRRDGTSFAIWYRNVADWMETMK